MAPPSARKHTGYLEVKAFPWRSGSISPARPSSQKASTGFRTRTRIYSGKGGSPGELCLPQGGPYRRQENWSALGQDALGTTQLGLPRKGGVRATARGRPALAEPRAPAPCERPPVHGTEGTLHFSPQKRVSLFAESQ